jgi:hypothetical protein
MKENQKALYEHYKAIATNSKKDKGNKDFSQVVRDNCAKYAAEILNSFPEFEKKEEKVGKKESS